MVIPTGNTASQFTQIIWIFAAILVLYILFGLLFIVFSHLQERLQRRPESHPLRHHTSWDAMPFEHKDVEGQTFVPISFHVRCEYPGSEIVESPK
ncbi:hypothetical protein R3P38DRAFT_2532289 [Favolaschia claudopus]|uniref:Uncharacterized protein n=1 Tax=Favolaschia claudopus TaxID=2862362 RepID=A0AAW0BBL9_9AGAR